MGGAWIVAGALAACDADTSADDGLEPVETARDTLAYGIAEVLCAGATSCCVENGLERPGGSCVTALRNDVFVEFLVADDQRREVLTDGSDACIDAYRAAVENAASCEELPHPVHIRYLCPQVFGEVAEGTRPPGDLCTALHQCASPDVEGERVCRTDQLYQPATCTWLLPIAEGDVCGDLGGGRYGVCGEGLGCAVRGEDPEPRCGPKQLPDQPCVDNDSCAESYVCGGGESLRCIAPVGIGGSCEFAPLSCDRGLICDDISATCIDVPILRDCGSFICPHALEPYCVD